MADAASNRQVIKFTDLTIKNLKPQANRYTVWSNGGNGFGLRVSPSGDRSFIYWYRFGTRKRLLTLGKYPATTLAVAAKRHADARHLVEQGKDPGELKQVAKQEFKAAPTVAELLEEYKRLELDKQTRGAEAYRMLKKDLLPALGHKKAQDVARRDVVVLLDAVRQRAPVLANRLQGRIVRMFNFAADRGVVSHNALARMSKVEEKPRERALSDAEVSRLWARLGTVGIFKVTELALRFQLATGQRPGDVAGMAKSEVQGDTWVIPAERYKNREAHAVPLSPLAKKLLQQAADYNENSPYVFPSPVAFSDPKAPKAPLDRHSLSRAVLRHLGDPKKPDDGGLALAPFTPHDLRRTVRTNLAALGVSDVIAERVMGHKLQGLLAVYNKHDYAAEKREALIKWARKLQKLAKNTEA